MGRVPAAAGEGVLLGDKVMQLELSFSLSVFGSTWIMFIGFTQQVLLGLEALGRERCAGLFWFSNQHQTFLD